MHVSNAITLPTHATNAPILRSQWAAQPMTPGITVAHATQQIGPQPAAMQVMAPGMVAPCASLDIGLAPSWTPEDVVSFVANARKESKAFDALFERGLAAGGGNFEVSRDPHARSMVRDGGHLKIILLAAQHLPTRTAMHVTFTLLLAEMVAGAETRSSLQHYLQGGTHAEPTSQLEQTEQWATHQFGSGVDEARFVAKGLSCDHLWRECGMQALQELRGKVLPEHDEHIEYFTRAPRRSEREAAQALVGTFREARQAVPHIVAPTMDGAHAIDAFITRALEVKPFLDLYAEARSLGWQGESTFVDGPGNGCSVKMSSSGIFRIEFPVSLSHSRVLKSFVHGLIQISLSREFAQMDMQFDQGVYHAHHLTETFSDEARALVAAGHHVGAAEYAATGQILERVVRQRTCSVLDKLVEGRVLASNPSLRDFVAEMQAPENEDAAVEDYLQRWGERAAVPGAMPVLPGV